MRILSTVVAVVLSLAFLATVTRAEVVSNAGTNTSPPPRKPNIIVILADDLGYGDLGVYGGTEIPTPNLDALARGGVRFTDGYVTCPICAPTRAALLSGRYQQRFGFEHNPGPEAQAAPGFGLPRSERTLAEKLKDAGYATGMFGKWHLGYKDELQPHQRGFDEFFGFLSGAHTYLSGEARQRRGGGYNEGIVRNGTPVEEKEYLTDAFAREAVAFITKHAAAQHEGTGTPYFVYLPFNAVHGPMEATKKYTDRYAHISDANRRTYAGMLTALDEAVGRVLAAVKDSGQEDNTLVFFFSDNGGPTPQTTSSNKPLSGYKGQVLEGGVRVPFLMKWPGGGVPAGKVYELPVMSLDVHATVLAAADYKVWNLNAPETDERSGRPQPGMLEGHNLVPFVTATGERGGGAKVGPHEALFWRMGNQWAVRKGDWKLLSQARANARQQGEVRLYNLREDIGETTDLAGKMPEKVAELRAAYDAWNAGNIDPLWRRSEGRGGDDEASPAPGNQPDARPAGRGAGGAGRIREAFDRLDTNKDGSLTADEYNADAAISARRPFAEIDANKDGKASYEEIAAAFRTQRRGGGG